MDVSIIIPAYNAVNFIERAFLSARSAGARLATTGKSWELFLVDNNSTDGTLERMRQLAAPHPEVSVLSCPTQGVTFARNLAFAHARGTWIQYLDADDYLDDDKLLHQLESVDPAAEWIISGYRDVFVSDTHPGPPAILRDCRSDCALLPHPDPWQGLVLNLAIGCTHANLYRRATLAAIGNYDETVRSCHDVDLHLRLLLAGAPYHIDPAAHAYYVHHDAAHRLTTANRARAAARLTDIHRRANAFLTTECPAYWAQHRALFRGALLRRLRRQATYNLTAAARIYQEEELQAEGALPLNPDHQRLYPIFGFAWVEGLRRLMGRWRRGGGIRFVNRIYVLLRP